VNVEEQFAQIAKAEGFPVGVCDQVDEQEMMLLAELNQTLREAVNILLFIEGNTTLNLVDLLTSVHKARADSGLAFDAAYLVAHGAALMPRDEIGTSTPREILNRHQAAVATGAPEIGLPYIPLYVQLPCECAISLPELPTPPFSATDDTCTPRRGTQCSNAAIQLGRNDRCPRHLRPSDRRYYDAVMHDWEKHKNEVSEQAWDFVQHVGAAAAGHWFYRHTHRETDGVVIP
jgi:hypothetical protein